MMTTTKTPEQLQQKAEQEGWLKPPKPWFSLWYPWFRLHFISEYYWEAIIGARDGLDL